MAGEAIPVSAVLITRDAERHLERVLDPLGVCAEIVVLDSGSSDRTEQIARAAEACWHSSAFDGYGPQKRRAVALADNDWVLSVDADEVLDDEAVNALVAIDFERADPRTCWRIRRRNHIGSREIRHGHWSPNRVVRLFNRRHHNVSEDVVHESVRPTGPVCTLPGSLLHYSYVDYADLFRVDYHRLKADRYRHQGRRATGPWLALRAAGSFLHSYLLRFGVLDGRAGVVVALSAAVNAVVGFGLASEPDPVAKFRFEVDETAEGT